MTRKYAHTCFVVQIVVQLYRFTILKHLYIIQMSVLSDLQVC